MDSFGVRVGSAAFALGLGLAVASNPGVAAADDSEAGGQTPDSSQASSASKSSKPSASSGRSRPAQARGVLRQSPASSAEVDAQSPDLEDVAPEVSSAAASAAVGGVASVDEPVDAPSRSATRSLPSAKQGSDSAPVRVATPDTTNDSLGGASSSAGSAESAPRSAAAVIASAAAVSDGDPVAVPQAAAVTATATSASGQTDVFSGLLSVFGLGGGQGSPFEFISAALALVSRELKRLIDNSAPDAAPALISAIEPGLVEGTLSASDAEGDPLKYVVTNAPANGTVSVDAEGNFTYTADEEFAATGGVDAFTVEVQDKGFHLSFWKPTTKEVTVQVVVNPAGGGSLGGGASAAAATGVTTAITWDYGKKVNVAFDPTKDKLNFGWMGASGFDVTESAGSTVITVVDNQHSYTLTGVSVSQLSMTNIIANDAGTVAKWQGVINGASQPSVSVGNATKAEGNSGTSNLAFTVSLSKASTKAVTVQYATSNGTATAGQDYVSGSGTITFAAGETTKTVNVVVNGDTTVEADETLNLTLSNATNANLGTKTGVGTITNDDVAASLPNASIANVSKAEGNSGTANMAFTVTLSKASTTPVTINYATSNGTAAAGEDYTSASGTLTFAAGETSKTINVAVTGDATVEADETFTVTLSGANGANITTASATGTITNDDVAVSLPNASIANVSKAEGNSGTSNMAFTVTLSKASTTPVTINYATSNGTASAGEDYTSASGTLTFAAGETSKTINVAVTGDATVEADETFTVTLSGANGANITTASATGTITNDDTSGTGGSAGQNSGNPGDERWGEAFYAPYVDMAAWPAPDLVAIAQQHGVSLLTLAFIQATDDGKAAWGAYPTLTPDSTDSQALAINASIAAFKAAGGDVMISFGGENGTSLAQWYSQHGKSAQELANAYGAVVDAYGLNRIDFDIEGAAVADPGSIALNAQALKILQTARPDLEVWYTLPVLPKGLTAEGINVVDQALKAGVKLDGVNVMAMNFGASVAPTTGPNAKTMGAYSIESAQSTYDQMTALFGKYGQSFGWNQVGVTPMIGVNYTQGEVFTVADAQALEDFVRAKGIGMLSMWSVQRDTPGTIGQASPSASGVSDPAGAFGAVWKDYGTINPMDVGTNPGGGGTGEVGTTTVIGWSWGQNKVINNFNPSVDKLDFQWMQPGHFDVAEVTGSTVITIKDSGGQTYTLAGVKLADMKTSSIIALDGDTKAKWQSLIAGAQPTTPTISISNASKAEGNSGSANMAFTVTLSKASNSPITVNYATANGTAAAGQDYTSTSGTVTFAAGETSKTINVAITGDAAVESDETFTVTLSNPSTGATIKTGTATGTITNDDVAQSLPTVSIGNASKSEGNSGTSTMSFTVSLSQASSSAVTVNYATSNGTAMSGQDYTATSGTLTFAAGETSKTVNVVVAGDSTIESDETFTVTLSSPSGATIGTATATGTITNDDVAQSTPSLSIANVSKAEGNTGTSTMTFTVTLSQASTSAVSVNYATSNGTATSGQDYTATSGTLTFAAGETSKSITVAVTGDTTVESAETFTVTLSSPNGATIATASATGTITNDDSDSSSQGTLYKVTTTGADIIGFDPAKDKLDLGDVSVHSFIVVDTAEGVGFRNPWTGDTIVLQGVSLGQLTVDNFAPILNDHLRQDLSGAMAWEHGITMQPNTVYARSHEVGQIDRVAFNPATDVVDFRYYGTREQISMVDSVEGVIISNAGTGQALILQGVTKSQLSAKNFVFHPAQVREDRLNEQLDIGAVTDAQVKDQGVPIAGTNKWPTEAGNGTAPTGETGTTTTVSWKWGSHETLTFDPTKDKLDFVWFQASNFDVTEVSGSTRIEIVDNNQSYTLKDVTLDELSTTNIIALDADAQKKWRDLITAAQPAALPKISVADARVREGNSGTSTIGFVVTLSEASTKTVTVSYTTTNGLAGAEDFTSAVGTLTFAPGETSKTINVSVLGDNLVELDENFVLSLSSPTNAAIADGNAIGTIENDDVDSSPNELPKITVADMVQAEMNPGDHSHFMVEVKLDKASTETITVKYATSDGTAVGGVDYDIESGTITFAPGVTSQKVHVGVKPDTVEEGDETFTFTLSDPSGATMAKSSALITIKNDDSASNPQTASKLSVSDASVQEGDDGSKQMVFAVNLSAAAANTVTVKYHTEDFSAAAGTDYTALEGVLTFLAGETSKSVQVAILGDKVYEGNESLVLVFTDIHGAEFDDAQGVGLIVNDDTKPVEEQDQQYRVVGYFAEWSIYARQYEVSEIEADKLTDIMYAFADVTEDGRVVLYDRGAAIETTYPGDKWDQPIRGNFNQLAKLKQANPDVNVFISIGGWTLSDYFSNAALNDASRAKFAASAIEFMKTYGFDGIDLDWEYPVSGGHKDNIYRPEDKQNYVLLVKEIRRQLDALEAVDGVDKRYMLTIASPAGYDKIENYDLDAMEPYLDFFDVMAYDFHGGWEPNKTGHASALYGTPDSTESKYYTDYAIDLYLQAGVDPSKIVLGAPMYAHTWSNVQAGNDHGLNNPASGIGLDHYGTGEGVVPYWKIIELLETQPNNYKVYWDDQAKASYIYSPLNGGTFISYESLQALQLKLDYIKDKGLGGMMFWQLDDDIRNSDDPDSLLGLAARELLGDQNA